MPRIYYEVFGKVQAVGFRMSVVDLVRSHFPTSDAPTAVVGFVRNTERDTVEGEAQSPSQASLDDFVKQLEAGPAGRVDRVETKVIAEKDGETRFSAQA